MNILQLMVNKLAGYEPLQNKILMYCLGSPSASAIKLLCNQVEVKRQDNKDESTAWNYYKSEIKSTKPRKFVRSFLGWCIREELKLLKIEYPYLTAKSEQIVNKNFQTHFDIKISDLTAEQENGTPSGIVMRKYIKNLLKKGYVIVENETIWAKFSCGELISNYTRRPLTVRQIKPEVHADLTRALGELTKLRTIYYYKDC